MSKSKQWVIKNSDGFYYQWRSRADEWRGQWVKKEEASRYSRRTKMAMDAVQKMWYYTLTWEAV